MLLKVSTILVLTLCATSILPADCINRWFSASYLDLRVTLRRYAHCVGDLAPLREGKLNETDFLVHQMKAFLDAGNYDNEQLSNVTALMDNICRPDLDSSYPISVNIDVNKYSNASGKEHRCRAIDQSLDAMYGVFRRASLNRSEPLDFSVIQFYPNASNKAASYNLTDLINTGWIKSEMILEHVCKITDAVKDYVQTRTSNSTAQDRSQQQQTGALNTLMDIIDRFLEPFFGVQKRLYWETNNRLELVANGIGHGLDSIRHGISKGLRTTRDRIVGVFGSSTSLNSTLTNVTSSRNNITDPGFKMPVV